jgi:hypothetical protein
MPFCGSEPAEKPAHPNVKSDDDREAGGGSVHSSGVLIIEEQSENKAKFGRNNLLYFTII